MKLSVLNLRKTNFIGITFLLSLICNPLTTTAEELNVRFSWKMKGEYAPLYHTKAIGEFKSKGLSVNLGEGAGSQAALGALVQGQEDVVIMPAIFAMTAIQKGMPVKIAAVYHRSAPVVFISHPEAPILKPSDLEGKKLASAVGETGTSYLSTFCAINNIDCNKIKLIQMDRGARVPQFLQKQVDAVSAYLSNDLPILEKKTGIKFPVLNLGEFGLEIPGMSAVVSDKGIKENSDALSKFLKALGSGMMATKDDPSAATASLRDSWDGAPSSEIVEAQVKATIDAVNFPTGKPVGWIDEGYIQATLDMLTEAGTIKDAKAATDFFTNDLNN